MGFDTPIRGYDGSTAADKHSDRFGSGSALNSAWGKDGLEQNAHSYPPPTRKVVMGKKIKFLIVAGDFSLPDKIEGIGGIALACGNCFIQFQDFI